MKAGEARRQLGNPVRESFVTSVILSACIHGVLVVCVLGSTWLWGGPVYRTASAYTVALVDDPLTVRQPPPVVDTRKPAAIQKRTKPQQPTKSQRAAAKSKRSSPAASKRSKAVKPATQTRQKAQSMTLPATKTKQAPAPVTRRTIARKDAAKSQTASSGEVRSAIAQLQRRQGDREPVQQRATKAQQEAAARRVATLRERLTQAAAPASTTEMATSMQRIRLQWYQERIRERIIAAWILPLPRGDTHDLRATALMRVGRDGQVEHLQLVRPSGNLLFDESLLGAIKRAAPWPELPADYAGEFLEVEMHFSARDT